MKTLKAISLLKEDRQALGLFVSKCMDKETAFHYPLTTYPLTVADPSGTFYQPTGKHLFRNKILKSSCNTIEKNPS